MLTEMYFADYDNARENIDRSPRLASLNYIQASQNPEWSFHIHTHENLLEVSYVIAGKGALYCGGRFYEIIPGDIVIKNPGVSHTESSDRQNPIEQACLLIDGLIPANEFPLDGLPPVVHAARHRKLLDAMIADILGETVGIPRPNLEYVDGILAALLRVCRDEVSNAVYEREHVEKKELVEKIRDYLDKSFAENISLTELSGRFHISMYHLARQFKKYTGFTVNNYLVSCRIGEAQRLLIYKSESIENIARKSGFHELSYFYSCFRKKVGCTPAEYRLIYGKRDRI